MSNLIYKNSLNPNNPLMKLRNASQRERLIYLLNVTIEEMTDKVLEAWLNPVKEQVEGGEKITIEIRIPSPYASDEEKKADFEEYHDRNIADL